MLGPDTGLPRFRCPTRRVRALRRHIAGIIALGVGPRGLSCVAPAVKRRSPAACRGALRALPIRDPRGVVDARGNDLSGSLWLAVDVGRAVSGHAACGCPSGCCVPPLLSGLWPASGHPQQSACRNGAFLGTCGPVIMEAVVATGFGVRQKTGARELPWTL